MLVPVSQFYVYLIPCLVVLLVKSSKTFFSSSSKHSYQGVFIQYVYYLISRWNPAKRPSAQQALRYPYFQVGTNKQPNGHIMEQTLQRSYARKSGLLPHQLHHQVRHIIYLSASMRVT